MQAIWTHAADLATFLVSTHAPLGDNCTVITP